MKIGSIHSIVGQYNKMRSDALPVQRILQPATDQIDFSPEAVLFTEAFSMAKKSIMEETPDRTPRVNDIMQQMRIGTYCVEAQALCDKLLD